jgi:predicted porin
MKKTSLIAVIAAAGLFAGGAQAADLGGNCCTDLEERVAELEATTARKGNRNVSLTVYGQVNEMIMFWDDGVETNAYVGTNDDSRSRFGFRGNAKINSEWTAGFVMELGIRIARSDRWNANQDSDPDDPQLDVRKSAWYLQSSRLGRLTVGRESTADSGIVDINLARVNAPRYDDFNDRFGIRNAAGGQTGRRWDQTVPPWSYNPPSRTRQNIVRYDSPTYQGFTFSANWGEDDYWAAALRYANEFNGVRVAAGIAYSWLNEPNSEGGCTTNGGPNGAVDCEAWGLGASVMHVASGLFVSGGYGQQKDNLRPATAVDDTDSFWVITAGIERTWIPLGKTTLYGTYYNGENNFGSGAFDKLGQDTWSIGLNQQVSAAAMDLYIAYYNSSATLETAGVETPTQDFQAVITGAKIRF